MTVTATAVTVTATPHQGSKLKWRLCSANGHWYGRVNPYRVDEDPRVGALAKLSPLKEGRRRIGWTLWVGERFVNTHGQLRRAKQQAEHELAKMRQSLPRALTREEFDAIRPQNHLELRHGQEWKAATVLGRCGPRLHVGFLTDGQVVGYLFSWIEAADMLRFPAEEPHVP